MSEMKHECRKGTPVDISKFEDPPEYEKDERWIKLNEDFENAENFDEMDRILKEIDEIEKSYNENNTHKEDSI